MKANYRVRFRFRVNRRLDLEGVRHVVAVRGHTLSITADADDTPIRDSLWLIANTTGFESEDNARRFAKRLRTAMELGAAATRIGLDGGVDRPTCGLGEAVRQSLLEKGGLRVRDNVHGIDVVENLPDVRYFKMQMTGVIHAKPARFFELVDDCIDKTEALSHEARNTILLMNYALLRDDPVATIVFAISAVEALGQADWSDAQKQLLQTLESSSREGSIGTAEEREEVAQAIRRAHRFSLRQGVTRLLDRLDLRDLRRVWDAMYEARSKLVHGLAPMPGVDYSQQANDTLNLCGRILMTLVAREIPAVAEHIDVMYPTPK